MCITHGCVKVVGLLWLAIRSLFIAEIISSFGVRDTMIGVTETAKEQGSSEGVTCFFFLECCISHTSEM